MKKRKRFSRSVEFGIGGLKVRFEVRGPSDYGFALFNAGARLFPVLLMAEMHLGFFGLDCFVTLRWGRR